MLNTPKLKIKISVAGTLIFATIFFASVNHTSVDMTNPTHGYSGGITTGSGNDGVFVYSFPPSHLP